jgi:hypothetical protein
MRRLLLCLITALLTFSIGSFLHLYIDSPSYNNNVRAREIIKRRYAEYVAPIVQGGLSKGEILWRMRKAGCRIQPGASCLYAALKGPKECREYQRLLFRVE